MAMNAIELLKSLTEAEFTELVVLPLLEKMGYSSIRRLHGKLELGKDIVAIREDPIQGPQNYAFALKSEKISGSARSSGSARNCIFQLQQALQEPWLHPDTGHPTRIEKAYLVCSHEITQEALISIKNAPDLQNNRIVLLDVIQLIELINRWCPELLKNVSDEESRYIQSLAHSLAYTSSIASIPSGKPISLRDTYVGGKLIPTTYEQAIQLSFATLPQESQLTASDLESLVLQSRHRPKLCVVADVGAGKTSLLQKFVLDTADRYDLKGAVSDYPLFLRLATFRPTAKGKNQDSEFEFWFEDQVSQQGGEFLKLSDQTRRSTVLLDGFDEIPSEHDAVWSAIERFSERYPASYVVTTRPSRVPRVASFELFRLLPFSDQDISDFLAKWFADGERKREILNTIRTNDHLLRFCRTPLLLTLLAAIAKRVGVADLPTRRTQFYEKAIGLLLTWDTSRGVVNVFPESVKLHFLQDLAIEAHGFGIKQIRSKSLLLASRRAVTPVYKQIRLQTGLKSEDSVNAQFIDEVVFRSNLLRRIDSDQYEFSHLSFQEYFSASQIRRTSTLASYFSHALDSWWRGVMLFAMGFSESMPKDYLKFLSRSKNKLLQNSHFLLEYAAEAPYTEPADLELIFQVVANQFLHRGPLTEELVAECRPHSDSILNYLFSNEYRDASHTFRIIYLACRLGGDSWRLVPARVLDRLSNERNGLELLGLRMSELTEGLRAALAARPVEVWAHVSSGIFNIVCDQIIVRLKNGPGRKDPSYPSSMSALRNVARDIEILLERLTAPSDIPESWKRRMLEISHRLQGRDP